MMGGKISISMFFCVCKKGGRRTCGAQCDGSIIERRKGANLKASAPSLSKDEQDGQACKKGGTTEKNQVDVERFHQSDPPTLSKEAFISIVA